MECDCCSIKNLIYQYAQLIDDGDLDGVAALFEHGEIVAIDHNGEEANIVGAAAVGGLYRSFTRLYEDDGSPHTLHMTTNVAVSLDPGAASASANSYAVVFQALADFALQPIIGVHYLDEFSKHSGRWRFSRRRIETRLTGDLSRHLLRRDGV